MRSDSNPVYAEGEKNVFCPYYGECLNHACRNGWEYWACQDCEHRGKKEPVAAVLLPSQNYDSYYSISPALFLKNREFIFELV